IYLLAAENDRYGARKASCGGMLRIGWSTHKETGETRQRLSEAHFCRVRHSPVSQWRRTLMRHARIYQSLPRIVADYP
ncbi:protein rep, partial [Salmonella enterica]|uniref:protein rep n=1 Tax=Salmonella enterica TaxID=28901 RepID=UPI000AC04527